MGILDDIFKQLQTTQSEPVGTQEMRDSITHVPSQDELKSQALRHAISQAGIAIAQTQGDIGSALGNGVAAGFGTYDKETDPGYRQGLLKQAFADSQALHDKQVSIARSKFDDARQLDTSDRQNKVTDQSMRINAAQEQRAAKNDPLNQQYKSDQITAQRERTKAIAGDSAAKRANDSKRTLATVTKQAEDLIMKKRKELGVDDPTLDEDAKAEAETQLKVYGDDIYHKLGVFTKDRPAQPSSETDLKDLPTGAFFVNPADGKLYRKK